MKPYHNIARTTAPDGAVLTLHEHDGEWHLKWNSRELMSTTSTTSELMLGQIACEHLEVHREPRVLIGGLGFGYSLRAVLEVVSQGAEVHVSELLPEIVAWNREFLMKVNGALLDDRRVTVFTEDVFDVIRRAGGAPKTKYDAILLDVDNGPTSFIQPKNARLYDRRGFQLLQRALKPNGRIAFWSAVEEPQFVRQLTRAGFSARVVEAKAHERAKRAAHRIYVAEIAPPDVSLGKGAPAPKPRKDPGRDVRSNSRR
ncbi:MAG TPA: hypothetical protein VF614_07490 [Chthoniobacteraceae bacterium]|jgi:spermidine synthase